MRRPKKHILVACHDAGSAEVISAYIKKRADHYRFSCVVSGPAKKIFIKKQLLRFIVPQATGKIDMVLCGTSWISSLEREVIQKAKEKNIKSVVYLDHWTNYRERFGYPKRNWQNNLPDEIWVGDAYAVKLARRYFKHRMIKFIPNAYFQEVKATCRAIRGRIRTKTADILFISEPAMLAHKTFYEAGYRFDETDILKKVLDCLAENKIKNTVVICYHPAEKKNKYIYLLARYHGKLHFREQNNNLLKDLVRAKLVIGRRSMALALAALCGKKTVSFIPDRKVAFPLPFKEIIRIRDIKQLGRIL